MEAWQISASLFKSWGRRNSYWGVRVHALLDGRPFVTLSCSPLWILYCPIPNTNQKNKPQRISRHLSSPVKWNMSLSHWGQQPYNKIQLENTSTPQTSIPLLAFFLSHAGMCTPSCTDTQTQTAEDRRGASTSFSLSFLWEGFSWKMWLDKMSIVKVYR